MKKLFALLLTLCCLCSFMVPASADVLWEPWGDRSYDYEKADTVARIYFVPEDLTVNIYSAPQNGRVLANLEPGNRVYVGFTQEFGGETWGVGYTLQGEDAVEGWFRVGRLQLEYDHKAFMDEFAGEVSEVTATYNVEELTGAIPTWTYPGSGIPDRVLKPAHMSTDYNDGRLEMNGVYVDPEGGEWGYVGYYMGHCGWAYLTDLYAENPPRFPHEAENTVTDRAPTEQSINVTIFWLIGGVVLITAGLIVILKKKSKKA